MKKLRYHLAPMFIFIAVFISSKSIPESSSNSIIIFGEEILLDDTLIQYDSNPEYLELARLEQLYSGALNSIEGRVMNNMYDALISHTTSVPPQGIPYSLFIYTTKDGDNHSNIELTNTHAFSTIMLNGELLTHYYFEKTEQGLLFDEVISLRSPIEGNISIDLMRALHFSSVGNYDLPAKSTYYAFNGDVHQSIMLEGEPLSLYKALFSDHSRQSGLSAIGLYGEEIYSFYNVQEPFNCSGDPKCPTSPPTTPCGFEHGDYYCDFGDICPKTKTSIEANNYKIQHKPMEFEKSRSFRDDYLRPFEKGRDYIGYYYTFGAYMKTDIKSIKQNLAVLPHLYIAMDKLTTNSGNPVIITPALYQKSMAIIDNHRDVLDADFQKNLDQMESDLNRYAGLHKNELLDSLNIFTGSVKAHPSCGGYPITNETIILIDNNGNPITSIAPIVTDNDGKFEYKYNDLNTLSPNMAFGFSTTSNLLIKSLGYHTLDEWINISPIQLLLENPTADFIVESISCKEDSIHFTNNSFGGSTLLSYYWDFGNGTISTQPDTTILYSQSGTYTVTLIATDEAGCSDTTTSTVTVSSPIELSTTTTDVSCNGANDGSIDLTVTGGTPPYTYNWSNGATTEDLSNLTPAVYTVTVTDDKGCSATDSTEVLPTIAPPANDNWSDNYANGGMNLPVWSIDIRGTEAYLGGDFTTAGGVTAETVAKWDLSQNNWTDRAIMPLHYFVDEVAASSTNVYIGGFFWASPDMTITSLAEWQGGASFAPVGDELYWSWWGPYVYALAVSPNDEALYAGGGIDGAYGGIILNNIGRYKAGEGWNGLTGPSGTGVNNWVYDIAVSTDETVFAGGNFTTAGGITANYIAQWNSTSGWTTVGSGTGLTGGGVRTIAINGDKVYVGGFFTAIDGNTDMSHIAVYDRTTNTWSSLGTGINGAVHTIVVADNGKIYAGGSFSLAGEAAANNIARWNGTQWETLGSGTNGTVLSLAIKANELLAGGDFTSAGGKTNNYFAHYTIQGCTSPSSSFKKENSTHISKRLSHFPAMNSNVQENRIIFYPNPANHELNVVVEGDNETQYQLRLFNPLGQEILKKDFMAQTTISVSNIRPKGLYFIEVVSKSGTFRSMDKVVLE